MPDQSITSSKQKALEAENEKLRARIKDLEKVEERFELAMEGPNEGLWEWNPITKELYISPRLMETLGHKNKGHRTTTHEWLEWVHPDDRWDYERKVTEHLKGQTDHFQWEYRVKDTDGGYHWVLARGKASRDENGIAYRMVGSVGDITARKNAEAELQRAYDELEKRVNERTKALVMVNKQLSTEVQERRAVEKELSVAKEIAEQANRSKDKYLAAASHDLLQPLNAARLLVSTLQERKLADKDLSLVNRVHKALNNAEDLLTDLLEISKLDANAVSQEISAIPANRLLTTLGDEFQSVATQADVRLQVLPCNLGVLSDQRLLGRILRNFLSNAIRHSSRGRVLLGCRRRKSFVRFQVWDTGPGIPDDKLEEIFLEFRQLKNKKTNREEKGVGLGLAIVERISRMLDHPVRVKSVVGKGSVFSVDVPICEIASDQKVSPCAAATPIDVQNDLSAVPILVVDNDSSITNSMADLLRQWGAIPMCALSKRSAVSELKYSEQQPSMILADYHLDDGETGIEVIEAIHELQKSKIPAVIITADRTQELNKECERLGYYILNKPVKPAKLRALISHLLAAE